MLLPWQDPFVDTGLSDVAQQAATMFQSLKWQQVENSDPRGVQMSKLPQDGWAWCVCAVLVFCCRRRMPNAGVMGAQGPNTYQCGGHQHDGGAGGRALYDCW